MSKHISKGPKNPLPKNHGQTLGKVLINRILSRSEVNEVFLIDSHNKKELTFQTISEYTVNVASNLRNFGVKENDVIGIYSPNCWQSMIVMLASWYIGASVCPMNFNYTEYELEKYFRITKPKIVFTSENHLNNLINVIQFESIILYEECCSKYEEVTKFSSFLYQNELIAIPEIDTAQSVACILLSSGTTGLPKAVMLTHDNFLNIIEMMGGDSFGLYSDTVTSVFVPLFHVFGILNFMAMLYHGRKLVLMAKFHPETFVKSISEHQVSTVFTLPPILAFLASTPLIQKYNISSLKQILVGGSPLTKDTENIANEKLGNVIIRQMYGMTETTGPLTAVPKNDYKFGSVGKPLANIEIKIVNPDTNQILDMYETGEVFARGPTIMKGYMGTPEDTKNMIDEDHFLSTGDIGYLDEDGHLHIIDRLKELIKYKGFQVSPSELEAVISKIPGIKDVTVVGKRDERCGELTTAIVVREPKVDLSEDEIINFVARHISLEKQLHGGVVFVNELPKSSLGKTLKKEARKLLS